MKIISKTAHIGAFKIVLPALLVFALAVGPIGCNSGGLIASINVAAAAIGSAGKILQPANPQFANIANQTGAALSELSKLITAYDAADKASQPGIANEIRNALDLVTQNLTDILATVRVKNPQLLAEIQEGVAIANAVVGQILDHLPKKAGFVAVRAAALSAALPRSKAKSADALKAEWNQACSANHPEAMIR